MDANGTKLMPTTEMRARRLLESGRAEIAKRRPFAIRLRRVVEDPKVDDMDLDLDMGYIYFGISVKSEKQEFLSEERKLLTDEKKRRANKAKLRRNRRSRGRHRKPMTKREARGRKKSEGWIAPSLVNKSDRQIDAVVEIAEVFPIARIHAEAGPFDPAVMAAVAKGEPVPEGLDYQRGPRYGHDTLRSAVFARDAHKCLLCGASGVDGKTVLVVHHVGYWKGDRSDRMDNLATLCLGCHTSKNHGKNGVLHGWEPRLKSLAPVAFMNAVRRRTIEKLKEALPGVEVKVVYGAATKRERLSRNVEKSHANDAFCMGEFHPKRRARTKRFVKRRRNDRKLERFYDATYVDVRDGKVKKANELGCNRTKRGVPRRNPKNERPFRGEKKSKGRRAIRRFRHPVQAGESVRHDGKTYVVKTCRTKHNKAGERREIAELTGTKKNVDVRRLTTTRKIGGWVEVDEREFYSRSRKGGGRG